ncbi:MAG: glycosyltransferase family 39 protein, partial [Elusimicrobia bacterium]|nr:glycosyltransferase family 39 protein [Elusimicrobiota bacterium]
MSRARAILAIVAVSIAWHLKGLSAPPYDYHYHRQTNTAAIARHYAQGRPFLSPQIDWDGAYSGPAATEFPLYMWLTGKLWPLAGLGDVWGRLLSAACSALAAVYLFLFLDRRFSRAEAVWSAILFGVIPIEVYFGRTIQPEALALAATLAAFYHWDCFLDDDSPLHWCAAVLAAFLAIAHKLPYAYLLPALATLTLMRRGAAAFKRPLVLAAPIICAAGVWSWYHHASAGAYVVPDHLPELLAMLGGYAHFPYYVE